MSLLFDVIADLPEGIAVTPVFAANKAEALKAAKECSQAIGSRSCSKKASRAPSASRSSRSKGKRISPGQQKLPFAFDVRLNQIPEEWHQIAVRFRRANGIRDGDRERSIW